MTRQPRKPPALTGTRSDGSDFRREVATSAASLNLTDNGLTSLTLPDGLAICRSCISPTIA